MYVVLDINDFSINHTFYQEKVKQLRGTSKPTPIYMDGKSVPDTAELKVLNALGLTRYCCRKHMLTHVDLIDKI